MRFLRPRLLAVLALFLALSRASAVETRPVGREVYRQQCARCHGKTGQGVKGKYDEPLRGDWSVEKLSRYIARNMPDDDPGHCSPAESDAVARFLQQNFYRPAQKKNPPRVELARLTNRQFINCVSDLMAEFSGADAIDRTRSGLRASYYDSRNFQRDKKIGDRTDGGISFDFGTNSPIPGKIAPAEFSIQWRGSIVTDETGEYEFTLETPNGARLWVNDDTLPLIDSWVASGSNSDHRASIRLLGGRRYPLRVDFFKFKEKSASVSLLWRPPHGARVPVAAHNLSPVDSRASLVVATAFPADDSSVGYERGASISREWDDAVTHAAMETAAYATRQLDRLARTEVAATNRVAQVEAFCEHFVAAAFRRPLTSEQRRLFVIAPLHSAPRLEEGVRRVILLALKSPRFLYPDFEAQVPDDFVAGSRLALALWDSIPDARLRDLAARGQLHTPDQVREQAAKMMLDPRARAKVQEFFHAWLQMNRVDDLSKDAKLFPGFSPEIIGDLRTSLDLFLADVFWSADSDYRKLLLADDLFLNDRLARFYGIDLPSAASNDFVRVEVEAGQRSGVITHPYLLAAFSYQKSSSPIHRGVFLTRNIIGRGLKPPPMAVVFRESDFKPNMTMREKVAELTKPQSCQSCHSVINPLGFSLESYDAVGRYRTREGGVPIDPASDYVTDEGQTVHLAGARDLAQFAIGSEPARDSFIEHLFHHAIKQPLLAYGSETPVRLRESFVASGFNMRKLLVDMASISALYRMEPPRNSSRKKP